MAWGCPAPPCLLGMEVAQRGPVLLPHPCSDARVPAKPILVPGTGVPADLGLWEGNSEIVLLQRREPVLQLLLLFNDSWELS